MYEWHLVFFLSLSISSQLFLCFSFISLISFLYKQNVNSKFCVSLCTWCFKLYYWAGIGRNHCTLVQHEAQCKPLRLNVKKSWFCSRELWPAASYTRRNAPTFQRKEKNVPFLLSTCAAVIKRGRFPKVRKINCDLNAVWEPITLQEQLSRCSVQDVSSVREC